MPTDPFARALTDILLTQAPDFVGIYDAAAGWFTRVNPAGVQLLGYASEAALLAEPGRALRTPALAPADWAALCAGARHGGPRETETELVQPDGSAFRARIELTPFQVDDAPYLLVRIARQSRLRRAEEELAQSVRRYEAVFANATIGILVCDRAGAIVSANQVAHEQFGYAPDALAGQRIEVLVPNAAGRRHVQLREGFNAAPQVRSMSAHRRDLEGLRRDGSVFPVEVSLSYFHLDDELYAVAYVQDITLQFNANRDLLAERQRVERLNAGLEQKVTDRTQALQSTLEQLERHQAELAKALAAEQELGELKSRFVSMASHEFRTPLTAVLTSAALVEKYPAGEQQPQRLRHLDRIRQSVAHLNDILEEFLSVGRIEEGKVVARPAALHVPALLADTVADLQGLLKPGQTIVQDAPAAELVWLDPSLLRKILVNLLSNALKYSGDGSVVTVQATCAAGWLTLVVQDQGVGISEEDQTHLFERFFRARNVTNVPGTGLGLYIMAKYVELMQGTVALRSTLDVGTTVTIIIPYDENYSAD